MAMTPLPPAPQRTQDPTTFAATADTFVAALPGFVTEANALQTDVTTKQTTASTAATTATTQATNAATSATNAATSATTASNWAVKTGSAVSGSDWSAKEHAVGTSVTTGSAKDWATKTGGLVASTDYSAKYYAQAAQTAAAAAGAAAGLPSLTGNAGKILSVNELATGVEWTSSAGVPVGDTLTTANVLSSPAWLPCNGAVYLKSSYSSLATKLGSLQAAASHTVTYATAPADVIAVAYGNGTWVALLSGGGVATSTNGTSWTSQGTVPVSVRSIAFGGGTFVAVGSGGVITSTNGITWTTRTLPAGVAFNNTNSAIAYGGGNFMVVGYDGGFGRAMSSPDGITWTERTIANQQWSAIAYQSGYFFAVAGGAAGTVGARSTGAANFSSFTVPSGTYSSIAAGNGVFVAGKINSNTLVYSPNNGSTWIDIPVPSTTGTWYVTYGDASTGWLAASNFGYFLASNDGKTWRNVAIGSIAAFQYNGVAFGANKFIVTAQSSTVTYNVNPYGYDTATSFATPIVSPSPINGGLTTYIKAT